MNSPSLRRVRPACVGSNPTPTRPTRPICPICLTSPFTSRCAWQGVFFGGVWRSVCSGLNENHTSHVGGGRGFPFQGHRASDPNSALSFGAEGFFLLVFHAGCPEWQACFWAQYFLGLYFLFFSEMGEFSRNAGAFLVLVGFLLYGLFFNFHSISLRMQATSFQLLD